LLQICIGLSMVYFGLPLPLATMHNAGAALLVICMVTLLRGLWPDAGSISLQAGGIRDSGNQQV
jgi:heme A synthase